MGDDFMGFGGQFIDFDSGESSEETIKPEDIAFLEEQRVNKISAFSVPTLQHIAAVKISVALWMHPDVIKVIRSYPGKLVYGLQSFEYNDFDLFLETPRRMLSLLPLPDRLKRGVSNLLPPIGVQLLKWVSCKSSFPNSSKHINCVRWNMRGTVDFVGTLKEQITSIDLREIISGVYEKASFYCMETYIPMLWEKMPEERKIFYLNRDYLFSNYYDHFTTYWICVVRNELQEFIPKVARCDPKGIYDINCSVQTNMVWLSIEVSNLIALKYFWQKLTAEEIIFSIEQWIHTMVQRRSHYYFLRSVYDCGVLFFLLSQLSLEAQRRWIISRTEHILSAAFSVWPLQGIPEPTIQCLMHFLNECSYGNLNCTLIHNIRNGSSAEALRIMLKIGPEHFKKKFFRRLRRSPDGPRMVWGLVETQDSDAVTLIFDSIGAQAGKNTVLRCIGDRTRVQKAINSSNFHMLDRLIGVLHLCHTECAEMKLAVLRRWFNLVFLSLIRAGNWERADNFLRWGCASQEMIGEFKARHLNKLPIVRSLVGSGDFELLKEFSKWHCTTEIEFLNFKKECVSVENVFSMIDFISSGMKPSKTVNNVVDFDQNCFWLDSSSSSGEEEPFTYCETSKDNIQTVINEKPFQYRIFTINNPFPRVHEDYARGLSACMATDENECSLFERYVRHFCCDGDDRQLRDDFADSKYLCNAMHLLLTVRPKHRFAEALLNWCFGVKENVTRFKQELLVSEKGYSLFYNLINCHEFDRLRNWRLLRKLAQWFHPIPKAALDKFKALFVQKTACVYHLRSWKRWLHEAIFYLLDTFTLDTSIGGNGRVRNVPCLLEILPDVMVDPLEFNVGIHVRIPNRSVNSYKLPRCDPPFLPCNCKSRNKKLCIRSVADVTDPSINQQPNE